MNKRIFSRASAPKYYHMKRKVCHTLTNNRREATIKMLLYRS
uniref:Uncharacterized protein n=1 Tax=Rhizophora mucronata TaxID=61149 RepID=A0A2P2QSD2_RHIMU